MTVNSGNSATIMSSLGEPFDFSDLKAWIAQYELDPHPLTPVQRKAISDLMLSLRRKELELGDKDWISLLHSNPSPLRLLLP